ncbi:hypothetical protein [Candidatus Oleimmundimicrobium sp.]|uniref:hypothetical protein n=1 Tax=Candidatus Oleimmundimicrobium sp. TaxID=3060597 RepID=UPI00272691DE|nr:hypothetical protein [Candidatus Oleimmundimicrobium sp.]MDO8886487.1 hypothetical protein [Candidatus Oleimmundimicrobium sp.]
MIISTVELSEKEIKPKFREREKQLLFADIFFIISIFLFLGLFRPDWVVIAAYFLVIPYLVLTRRKALLYHFIVASIMAFIWMLVAKNEYGYNFDFLTVAGINLFPLFAWAMGLFGVYIIYSHFEHILSGQGIIRKILSFSIFYWLMLIVVETIAYHFFKIQNFTAIACQGLPIFGCIHAPLWMKGTYFAMGPLFFIICFLLKLKNPHASKI